MEKELHPKVSVIVPMYNCATYLPGIFQDMKEQTMRDFEMICVIDGATDTTLDIVKQYAAKDERIRYFYKENGGAGSARNYGLLHACGEYVMWIDADDRYSPDLLKEMTGAADKFNADEVVCLFDSYDYKTNETLPMLGFNRKIFPENTCVNPSEALMQETFSIAGSGPTNKLYRRAFVEENSLRYSTTKIANDTKFVYAAISVAKKVVGVHKNLIHVQRCINPDSITSNRGKHIQDVLIVYSELYEWLKERKLADQFRNTYCKSFKSGIVYNSQFGVNHEFIDSTVYMLNEKEPWIEMSSDDIIKLFGAWFDINKIKKNIKMLEANIRENKAEEESGVMNRLKMENNKLETMALIMTLTFVRYDRDFYKHKFHDKLLKQLQRTENVRLLKQLQRTKNSWNYKIGFIITWLPKKIYYFFKRKDGKNEF